MKTEGEKNTLLKRIPYLGGRIELHRAGRGAFKALVYLPDASHIDPHSPSGTDRKAVVEEVKRLFDSRVAEPIKKGDLMDWATLVTQNPSEGDSTDARIA